MYRLFHKISSKIKTFINISRRQFLKLYLHNSLWKMLNNDGLKKIGIKNRNSYYFNDMVKVEGFHFDKTVIDENL